MAKDKSSFDDHPVMGLIKRLQTFWVDWSHVSSKNSPRDIVDYEVGIDRHEESLDVANVVSSLHAPAANDLFADDVPVHAVALDLDVPAYLVPSSTPGHSHLYVDVKVPHHRYMALLSALADAGVIEKGYAEVSIRRGHSDLRLPWVEKGDQTPERPTFPDPGPVQASVPDFLGSSDDGIF